MSNVVELEQVRDAKKPVCEYCGQEEHRGAFQCPRIKAVEYHNDDDIVIVRFNGPINIPSK